MVDSLFAAGRPHIRSSSTRSAGRALSRSGAGPSASSSSSHGVAGDAFRPTGSLRIAADDEERAELEEEYSALSADGFDVEWHDELAGALRGRYPGGDLPSAGRGASAGARRPPPRRARGSTPGSRSTSTHVLPSIDETGAETVVIATDGYPSGLAGELEGLIVPTRGQVIATEPIAEQFFEVPALRSPRLRLLAPNRGWTHRRRGFPRRLAPGGVHRG